MSSPVDGNGKRDDPSAYAPKWARDSNREGSRETTTPQQSEQSVPEKAPASDQARQESRMPRSLDPQFLRDPPRAPREAVRSREGAGQRSGPRTPPPRYDIHERSTTSSPGLEVAR